MNGLFLFVVACLIAHELDAIQQHEWRFFFARLLVSDETAYRLFVAAHVPLLVWIMWAWPSPAFQIGFDLFAIAHAFVHWGLRKHPLVKFDNWFSWLWIVGGALLGLCHLLLLWWR